MQQNIKRFMLLLLLTFLCYEILVKRASHVNASTTRQAVVLQTDFGLKDSAVCSMKGVLYQIDPQLPLFDLTHEIPEYNIWEASFRLTQCMAFWPPGTVFVSVVDPGVGTNRKSVVALTKGGHYIVTPDNGTLTLVADAIGIKEIREIDEKRHRFPGSEKSHTFHGRDVYAFTAGRLAAQKFPFEEVGPSQGSTIVRIPYQKATLTGQEIVGTIPVLDPQFGNVWTNIPASLLEKLNPKIGDFFQVEIYHKEKKVFAGKIPYQFTFGEVEEGKPLLYLNSLLELSVALNMDSFSKRHQVKSGPNWSIRLKKN